MAADSPPADRPGWLRRHRVPLAAVAAVLLVRAVIFGMERFEVGLEHHFNAVLGYQFLCLLAVVVLAVWFLGFSGYTLRTKAVGALLVGAVAGVFFAVTRKVEFDGQMNPRFHFRWEPSGDELLAKHLAESGPATGGADLTIGPTDSPRFRGPHGDGTSPGVSLREVWDATSPRELWRHPVGASHGGIAVAGNSAVTLEQRGGSEVVVCYDRANGKERWSFAYPARFTQSEPMGGDGPRTTPTVADGDVYSLGATGELVCLDGKTGQPKWQRNILADNGASNAEWGLSGSPLVYKYLVIVNPGVNPASNAGKAVAAYDRATGNPVWANGKHPAAYASPQLVTLGGAEQVLVFDAAGLGGYDPATGAELWRHPWKTDMGMNSAQPVVVGPDRVFVSSEKSNGCAVVEVRKDGDAWKPREVWRTRALTARFCGPVVRDGYAYGLSDGRLTCVDLSNGRKVWADGHHGSGQLVFAGNVLVVTSEDGKLTLAAADPAEYRELGRIDVFEDRTWNTPALAGKQLLMRNHREMACLELP
jgi:outer membrane protein assembly factor BamB